MHFDIDLKILKVLHTLVLCGSITKCAQSLGLSAGAITYSVNKARSITGSRLFVRTKNGMSPDATALELSRRYLNYLSLSQQLAVQEKKSVYIHTHSLMEMWFSDRAQQNGAMESYCFEFRSYNRDSNKRLDMLRRGYVDIDIGPRLPCQEDICAVKLFSSSVSILMSRQYDIPPGTMSLEMWMKRPQARTEDCDDYYFASWRGPFQTKNQLKKNNLNSVSGCVINMIAFCSGTDYISLIPEFYVQFVTSRFPVICVPAPPEIDLRQDCFLHYHADLLRNPDLMKNVIGLVFPPDTSLPM